MAETIESIMINGEEYLTAKAGARFLTVSSSSFAKYQKQYGWKWMTRPGMGQRRFFRKKDLEPLLEFRPGQEQSRNRKRQS